MSNVPEFSILVEGLDAITLGDVYKAVFPKGILYSIRKQYLRSSNPEEGDDEIQIPNSIEGTNKSTDDDKNDENENPSEDTDDGSKNNLQYDEVLEDVEENLEELKEEPITDDYVYDQPIEDRFSGEREYVTREVDEVKVEDSRGSKTLKNQKNELEEAKRSKELSRYGASFRNWLTTFLSG